MIIQLVKGDIGKPGTLTCLREDGSSTWQPSTPYFARHDLIHYVVETTLDYRQAFWGLVARGKNLDEFGTRNGIRDCYTREANWAESLVGILQWPEIAGGPAIGDAACLVLLAKTCADQGLPAPSIDVNQLAQIRTQVIELHRQWDQVPAGGEMRLNF